jgi:hypothetical protein
MITRYEAKKAIDKIIEDPVSAKRLLNVFFDRAENFLEAISEITMNIPLEDVMDVLDKLFF